MSKRKYCGDLSESHIGEIITLYGWVNKVRDHGGVIFVDLRDTKGVTQVVFNPEEKESVWKRLEKLKTLIMQSKISITNESLMEEKIEELQLKINSDLNNLSKAFEIVKLTSKSFDDLNEFGIKLVNKDVSLIDLKEEIEKELYDLSMAHFNRYFVEPIRKIK